MHPARSFSYKAAWLAVRAAEPEPLASALRLRKRRAAAWSIDPHAPAGRHAQRQSGIFGRPGTRGFLGA